MLRVSDFIAQHLDKIGVKAVFLLSGGGMMHLIDAIAKAELHYVCGHHEQACAMAAEGYARKTGNLGVCYATSGPGATNILTGLVGAWQDSTPVLFVTGQSKRSQTIRLAKTPGLRQFGTFEVDIVPIVSSVTKYATMIERPDSIRYELEKAIFYAKSGRPGPVLLDIPLDVQGTPVDEYSMEGFLPLTGNKHPPDVGLINQILEQAYKASRPVLLIGHGVRCANAVDALDNLIRKLKIPVVTTQLAKDAVPYASQYFVGHCGPKGDRPGNFALQASDFIMSIGCSLHSQTIGYEADLFSPSAFKVQVDVDEAVLNRGDVSVDLRVESDVLAFITALSDQVGQRSSGADYWRERCAQWKRDFMVRGEPHIVDTPQLNFYELADALSDVLPADATIVTDAGSAFYVLGQAFRCKAGQRYIVSGALGAMGYALPAAIGAGVASPESPVICVTGDGSLHVNVHELATAAHNKLNLKIFVVENDGYASIRNTQKGFFASQYIGASRDSGVSLPQLDDLARAYRLHFESLSDRRTLRQEIERIMSIEGPVLCRIVAQPDQQIMPSVSSKRLPDGRMQSNPLHVMSPLLPDSVFKAAIGDLMDKPVDG